jgi:hypothetical protein
MVLSRVRTRHGLFLKEPLDATADFTMDDRLAATLRTFGQRRRLPFHDFVFQQRLQHTTRHRMIKLSFCWHKMPLVVSQNKRVARE